LKGVVQQLVGKYFVAAAMHARRAPHA
jgi:hypothetical protein